MIAIVEANQTIYMKTRTFLIFLLSLFLFGCASKKKVNYLQDQSLNTTASKLFENSKFEYRIQPNDIFSIRILGLDAETHAYFNVESQTGNYSMNNVSLYVNGYSIDEDGFIEMPTVGKLKLKGMTVNEAQGFVQSKVNDYFNNATVILKLVSFKISVLGEVGTPGYFFVYNNQATILEAIALAGGLTDFSDKEKVTLIRQTDKGTQAVYVDLTGSDVLTSEYYYLLPNDVVYIPSSRVHTSRINLELVTLMFAGISSIVLVLSFIQNQNQ